MGFHPSRHDSVVMGTPLGAPALLSFGAPSTARSRRPRTVSVETVTGVLDYRASFPRRNRAAHAPVGAARNVAFLGFPPSEHAPLRAGTGFRSRVPPLSTFHGFTFRPRGTQGLWRRRSRSIRLRTACSPGVSGLLAIAHSVRRGAGGLVSSYVEAIEERAPMPLVTYVTGLAAAQQLIPGALPGAVGCRLTIEGLVQSSGSE